MAVSTEQLAIEEGTPVRTRPYPPDFPGAAVMGEEEKRAVVEVIERKSPFRFYGPSPLFKVREFELAFARRMRVKHALAVSSGTASLIVGLRALGIGPGDEVLVPANTFIASPGSVLRCGATPVYVDIDESFNMDPEDLARKVSPRCRAIMPVHFEGLACDMGAIMEIAKRFNLKVIEDCAQACGASWMGRPVGSIGDLGAFSFQINKLITAGEGGALTTSDPGLYEQAVRAHDQGNLRDAEGAHGVDLSGRAFVGENYRMSELAGAVLVEQLKKLDGIIARLQAVLARIHTSAAGLPGLKARKVPQGAQDIGRRYFAILPSEEVAVRAEAALQKEGFPFRRLYGGHPVYAHPQVRVGSPQCPRAEDLLRRTVTLPLSPLLSPEEADEVARALRKVLVRYCGAGR